MSEPAQVIRVDPATADPEVVREVSDLLRRGGIVGMRTDTVYGLIASVHHPEALQRLVELKVRPIEKPFILLASSWLAVRSVTSHLPPVARTLGSRYWPGPLTLVLPGDEELPDEVKATGSTVAVRIPSDPLLLAVLREMRTVLAAPSANRPGEPPSKTADEVMAAFGTSIDLVLDGGRVEDERASTIVNCAGREASVVREGRIELAPRELLSG